MFFRRASQCERGNVAILFALLFGVMGVAAALAVDMGSLYLERREVQSAVDLAAIAAARDPANAFDIAREVITDAGFVPAGLTVQMLRDAESPVRLETSTGVYSANPDVPITQRFQPSPSVVNAVRVSFLTPGRLFFANSWSPAPDISATATAMRETQVAFSLGSRLAALREGLPNKLLNALLGSSISLTAVDYNGLANVQVSLFKFLDALAVELGINAVTYSDLLAASANHNQIAQALAAVANDIDKPLIRKVVGAVGDDGAVKIGTLVHLASMGTATLRGSDEPINVAVSALDILGASAILADGTKQIGLNTTLDLPNVVKVRASITVGEPAVHSGWIAVGAKGSVLRTAQIRILFLAEIPGALGAISLTVKLPLYLEIAEAEATVTDATCPSTPTSHGAAVIAVQPGIARLIVGNIDEGSLKAFQQTPANGSAKLVNVLGLVGVSGSALVQAAQSYPVSVSFDSNDIAHGVTKTVSTRTIVGSLFGSLLEKTKLSVDLLTLPLVRVDTVLALVGSLISPLGEPLDVLLNDILDTLGVGVGEADVRVYGVTCSLPVLVG